MRTPLFALLATGCPAAAPDDPDATEEPLEVEWDVLPRVSGGEYLRGGFTQVSAAAYASAVATGKSIEVWITSEDAAVFASIAPESTGSGVELERGAIIVREIFLDDGTLDSLTVMARSEPGYSPAFGDYWYGSLDADGWPRVDLNGDASIGPLVEACANCHLSRAGDGFLFGVPAEHRGPP